MATPLSRVQIRLNAILGGLYGDWLAQRGNALAAPMQCIHGGRALDPEFPDPALPESTLVVFVHGLMCTESIWAYPDQAGQSYATEIAAAIPSSAVFVRYTSGLPIATNAGELNNTLETLIAHWPIRIQRLILIGHSMGGLLIRRAAHQAATDQRRWLNALRECIYIGSPHDGSWLARGAETTAGWLRGASRDSLRIVGEVIDLRSEGIRNLSLPAGAAAIEPPLPQIPEVRHYAVSGSISSRRDSPATRAFGDGLVHEASARGGTTPEWPWTDYASFPGIRHIQLARHPAVGQKILEWLS